MGSVSSTTSETSSPIMAGKADPYADIDFEEINEQTNLANDEIKCLKVCFDLFDTKKQEFLSGDDLGDIMRVMGFRPSEEELAELLHEVDEDGSGEIEFGFSKESKINCCPDLMAGHLIREHIIDTARSHKLCATSLVEDPDMETMKKELKDAFRVYDKEGQGFITTETLRG